MSCFDDLIDVPDSIKRQIQEAKDPKVALDDLKKENARKKNNLEMQLQTQKKLMGLVENHPAGAEVGLRSILTNDLTAIANNSNVEYRQKALQGLVESRMFELKEKLSTTKFGFSRDKELGKDFVRAVFNEESSETARKLANQWGEASEFMRTRFNAHGGNVGKLEYGYIPQAHDRIAIGRTGKDEWVNFIRPLLDEEDLDLDYIYETIATGGLNKLKEGASKVGNGKSVANKNAEHRILHFKDADSWIKYQEKFGNPDPMAAIDNHIRSFTNDMALVEVMGPNPQNMFETLKVQVKKEQHKKGKKGAFDSYTDAIWNVVSGKVDNDLDGINKLGTAAQTVRAVNTATMLGSATLSSITDLGSLIVNTKYNNMSTFKVLGDFVKNFSVKNQEDAIRAGLGADVFNSEVTRRFSELGSGFWAKASEALMRATGMNIWTEAARKAFQAEYMHKLLNGRDIKSLSTEEHIKLLEEVQTEAAYAVLMPGARTRALTTAGKEKGTGLGELARTGTQFSSFVITFMTQHGARMFKQGTSSSKISYGVSLLTMSTLLGAGAMMLKDASKGYTARKGHPLDTDSDIEDTGKFWAAAMVQGGGMGIIGDLIFSDQTRYGNSAAPTLLGPTSSLIEDTVKLTSGNLQEAIKGETTNFGSEVVDYANRHANPVNTFYTKALIEQYIARNLKIFLDKEYERKERRKLRKRKKEYGQEKFEWLQN